MMACESISDKLSGYLDGELSQGDRQRVELHLDGCNSCRKQFEEMDALKQKVGKLEFGTLPEQTWSKIMNDIPSKAGSSFGWVVLIISTVILIGYGIYEFAIDDTVPALVKTAAAGVIIGTLALFLTVARQRLKISQSDKYKDIQI